MTYRIVGNFQGSGLVSVTISRRKLRGMLKPNVGEYCMPKL